MKVVWNLNFQDILENENTAQKYYDYAMDPTRSKFFCDKLPPHLCGRESNSLNVGLMKRNEPLTSIKTRKRVSSDPIKRFRQYLYSFSKNYYHYFIIEQKTIMTFSTTFLDHLGV